MEQMLQLRDLLWGPFTILLMLGTGIYLTVRTGFVQLWCMPALLRQLRRGKRTEGITPLQALCTSLGGTLGIGNLAGVAVAMTMGGAGAVFYMLLAAFFGMATKFAEIVLAVRFQARTVEGQLFGGPMLYLARGMGWTGAAKLFCVCCLAASLVMGTMTQTSVMVESIHAVLPVSPLLLAGVIAAVIAPILAGGQRFLAVVNCVLVPVLLVIYLVACGAVLAMHWQQIPQAVDNIFADALHPAAMGGGIWGILTSHAVVNGFAKGVFSNEAGLGSAPIAHGCAQASSAFEEGVLGAVEVFVDTCVVCVLTALVVLTSGAMDSGHSGMALITASFSGILGAYTPLFISVMIGFLAIAAVFGWVFYGMTCLRYLTDHARAPVWYRRCVLLAIVLTAYIPSGSLLLAADILIAPMTYPNLLAVWSLAPVVEQETMQYLRTQKRGRDTASRPRK